MKTRIVKLLLPFLILSMACSLSGIQPAQEIQPQEIESPPPDIAVPTSEEIREMNCEEMDLPCTLEEADPVALERSAEIYQELTTRFEEGESIEELKEWLEAKDEIRIVL